MLKNFVLEYIQGKVHLLKAELLLRRCTGLYRFTVAENSRVLDLEVELKNYLLEHENVLKMTTDREVYDYARQIIKGGLNDQS